MEIIKPNYLGLIHDAVARRFEGELTFVNYMCIDIKGLDYTVAAVYKSKKPNIKKGHKKYVLLFQEGERWLVTGRTPQALAKEKIHTGVLCTQCNKVVISLYRHDFMSCGCPNAAFADGGKDYLRVGAMDLSKTKTVKVNLLNDEIKVLKKKRNAKKS